MSREKPKHPTESVRKLHTELQAAYATPEDSVPRKRCWINPTARSLTDEYMMSIVKEEKQIQIKKQQKVNCIVFYIQIQELN